MVVCVAPELGLFFRINSRPHPIAVSLDCTVNTFLKHDSFLECTAPLELDDYVIETFLDGHGRPFGAVARSVVPEIGRAVRQSQRISAADKSAILTALGLR